MTLTRRAGLGVVATLALSGCARPAALLRHMRLGAPSGTPAAPPFPVAVFPFAPEPWEVMDTDKAAAALRAFDGRFAWQSASSPSDRTGSGSASAGNGAAPTLLPHWGVAGVRPWAPPSSYTPLEPALREANFRADALLPGTFAAFTAQPGPYGVPVSVTPTGIQYNVQAFREASVPPPADDWSVDDFENACAAIAGAARADRLTGGIRFALPPLVGTSSWALADGRNGQTRWNGALSDPTIWGAFVLGYGGSSAQDGRFNLSNPGAIAGLGRLVGIATQYGPPPSVVPHSGADMKALDSAAAIQFVTVQDQPSAKGTRYARFPRMPVRSVVPITVAGAAPARVAAEGGGWQVNYGPAQAPLDALVAAVRYAQWVYSVAAADPTDANGVTPVVADPSVQDAYWGAPARKQSGAQAAADWRNYALIQAGWPPTAGAGQPDPFQTEAEWLVFSALTQAVTEQTPLKELLATTTSQLNAAAAKYAGSAAKSAG